MSDKFEPIPEIIVYTDGVYSRRGVKLYGTLYRYSEVCERQLWFQARRISPDPEDDLLLIGRLIHEEFFSNYSKEVWLHGTAMDIVLEDGGKLIIMEIKRSMSLLRSYILQVGFYLYLLRYRGIDANAVLTFPESRRNITISWTNQLAELIREATLKIERVVLSEDVPRPNRKDWCKVCAYRDLCY